MTVALCIFELSIHRNFTMTLGYIDGFQYKVLMFDTHRPQILIFLIWVPVHKSDGV